MRTPWTPLLSATAAIGLAVAGCASQPREDEASRTISESACSDDPSNPLNLASLRTEVPRDPEIESVLSQGGDTRLTQINRQMYQTLRTLDAELRRQQQLAACKSGFSDMQSLQASAAPNSGSGAAGVVAAGGANAAGAGGGGSGGGFAGTMAASGVAAAAHTTLVRKSSVSPTTMGGGGNGAAAQKVSAGSDNDIVARRLRKAAEQETDPVLKAKLWQEYAEYQQGNATK